ncbi:N-acetylmuramic acid 6-phosphate etherase [bacterium]|nr:N-acetylmuramic acid 6-phosphate etherase [bacterium]
MSNPVFDELESLVTEARNPASENIDRMSTLSILKTINSEDKTVPEAVAGEIEHICQAVEIVVNLFRKGGRLFYVGAGTSGRLGVLDAAECPPTFGTPPEMIQGIIAGGPTALVTAIEGTEDQSEQGKHDLLEAGFTAADAACGIAASRRTPYVLGAIEKAREIGGKTLYVTCNPRSELNLNVDVAICPVVGPEVIMGSTRMKAGTATKLVLNMLTTAAMIRLGKVYGNMMVDLQMNSRKLEERSKRTVMMVTGVDYDKATEILEEAEGHVKTALVMILAKVNAVQAQKKLARSDGFVYKAISGS